MKTLLFIYNPAAGKAKITSALGEVTALFQKEDWLVTLYATKAAGDAVNAVQELGGFMTASSVPVTAPSARWSPA